MREIVKNLGKQKNEIPILLLGEKEAAMNLLRETLVQGVSYKRLHPNMDLDPLRDHPHFRELINPKG